MSVGLSYVSSTGEPFGKKTVVAAGSSTTDATLIPNYSSIIVHVTGANGTKGVKLPTASVGKYLIVENADGSNALLVYPPTGKTINGQSADTSYSLASSSSVLVYVSVAGAYLTLGSSTGGASLPATLTSAHLFVGNGSNVPADVALTGDASITNAGVMTNTGLNGVATALTGTEANLLHSVTAGTAAASKAVVLDANTAIGGMKVATGAGVTTSAGGSVAGYSDITNATSGTTQNTEYVLNSVTIKANSFNANTRAASMVAWGTLAANANAKNLKVYFGGTAVATVTGSTGNGVNYYITLDVVRLNSNSQSAVGYIQIDTGTSGTMACSATITETDTADIVVSVKSANTAAAATSGTGKGMVLTFGN